MSSKFFTSWLSMLPNLEIIEMEWFALRDEDQNDENPENWEAVFKAIRDYPTLRGGHCGIMLSSGDDLLLEFPFKKEEEMSDHDRSMLAESQASVPYSQYSLESWLQLYIRGHVGWVREISDQFPSEDF